MKRILLLSSIALLAACTHKATDPKAELADLKKQQAEINTKIADLEAKTGANAIDSSKITDVSVTEIKSSAFTNYVQIQGKIDAADNVMAYPQAQGIITGITVKAGDHVSKGQILVTLDNSVLLQNIAQTESQLSLLSTIYDRQKALWDQKIGTEVQFLQAQTNLQSGKKQLAALKQQADLYKIKSPISGTVDQMDLKLGMAASPGVTGIRIVNADNLKVKADVPESYATRINTGDNVKVLIPDANDSLVTKVSFAARVIDPNSRSFGVEVKLPSGKNLRPNMTVVLKIADYHKADAIVVPLNAIQKSELGDYVFVDENGLAKRKLIKVGTTSGSQTEVISGLSIGDKLITTGAADVEDGDPVKVLAAN